MLPVLVTVTAPGTSSGTTPRVRERKEYTFRVAVFRSYDAPRIDSIPSTRNAKNWLEDIRDTKSTCQSWRSAPIPHFRAFHRALVRHD